MVSLIDQLGTDLEETAKQLEDYVKQTKAICERLSQQAQNCQKGQATLEGLADKAKSGVRVLADAATGCLTDVKQQVDLWQEAGQKMEAALLRDAGKVESLGKSALESARDSIAELRSGQARVLKLASESKAFLDHAMTAGTALGAGLQRSHQSCLSDAGVMRDCVNQQKNLVEEHFAQLTRAAASQAKVLGQGIGEKAYTQVGGFLTGAYRNSVADHLQNLKDSAQGSVKGLVGNQIVAVRNEVKGVLNECLQDINKVARDVPDKLERTGKAELKKQAQNLVERMLVDLISKIVVSATTTSACSSAMPVIKAISVGMDLALEALKEMDK